MNSSLAVCRWVRNTVLRILSLIFLDFLHKAKKDVAQFFRIFPEMGKKGPKWVENRVFLEFLEKNLVFAGINHK